MVQRACSVRRCVPLGVTVAFVAASCNGVLGDSAGCADIDMAPPIEFAASTERWLVVDAIEPAADAVGTHRELTFRTSLAGDVAEVERQRFRVDASTAQAIADRVDDAEIVVGVGVSDGGSGPADAVLFAAALAHEDVEFLGWCSAETLGRTLRRRHGDELGPLLRTAFGTSGEPLLALLSGPVPDVVTEPTATR